MPTLKDEEVLTAIAAAPSSTVRSVLRALCANNDNKRLIGKMLSQLPLTHEQMEQNNTKKRKAVQQEVCVQCGMTFERGDESLSCRHHPYDMELDDSDDKWCDWPEHMEVEDTPNNRDLNPDGFTFPCCGDPGSRAHKGCTIGRHRAADGKRGKYQPSKTKSGILAALEELEAKERKERAENWVPKRDGVKVFASRSRGRN